MLSGNLMAGWQLARALLAAEQQLTDGAGDRPFLEAKVTTARFYAEHILCKAQAERDAIIEGAASVMALPIEAF
jgi:hypothetical protein